MLLIERTVRRPGNLASEEVARMAQRRLHTASYAALRSVSCECRGGVLYLRGRLSSYYHKQLAQEAVAKLNGVAQVVNEIEVLPPEGTARSRPSRTDR